ncbi:MAG TPA: sigma-54 dependent transcriptional regulator [Vicinamibacteria bacterium]|nr:sigma-54 dependent transcriptional regulator [Vicinamibacteria bacterium]
MASTEESLAGYDPRPADAEGAAVAFRAAHSARASRREVRHLRNAVAEPAAPWGESPAWRRIVAMVEAAAPADAPVLLLGESGTGKELLARFLHRRSARASGPFVLVNCAAVPLERWESEFFGHRRGSLPGAPADRAGRFQLADGGTLLLDEVAAMPAANQAKLLHVIESGEFEPLGDDRPRSVDVRIVASTNSDLRREVTEGRFRADLYHRLNVVRIAVPPLRDRPEDIELLTQRFAEEIAARLGKATPAIGPETLARIRAYSWPGNVRELKNAIERALILDEEGGLETFDPAAAGTPAAPGLDGDLNLRGALDRLERDLLLEALRRSGGVRKEAARLLGIDRRNLAYYLRKQVPLFLRKAGARAGARETQS